MTCGPKASYEKGNCEGYDEHMTLLVIKQKTGFTISNATFA